ncbi:MAG: SGNH/GDSL hydrolase family protein [Planctomycetota bacterium]|nr:SGNH/GDSL hydrolase family protein [Planctomycetota bacterium]
MFAKNTTILFQGDSITDGARGRNEDLNHILGHGYVFLIAARLTADRPGLGLRFHNRGCSGHSVVDLHARWREDALDLAPDVLSVLIGVNDVETGVPTARYETEYRQMLEETRAALPKTRFVLCHPFMLPVGGRKDRWKELRADIDSRIDVVDRLAREFQAVVVPNQAVFDAACQHAPAEYWLWDGIHPMPAGHELMAREWLAAVEKPM